MSGLEGLGIAANVIAVVDLSVKLINSCYHYAAAVKEARVVIDQLRTETSSIKKVAEDVERLIKGPNGDKLMTSRKLLSAVEESHAQLKGVEEALCGKLKPGSSKLSVLRQKLEWPFKKRDFEQRIERIRRCAEMIHQGLQIDIANTILTIDEQSTFDRIPVADGASFDASGSEHEATCLPGTRVELLKDVSKWVLDEHAKSLMWLHGKAGTGKSTISRTVAQSLQLDSHLGGTFFFKSDTADRSSLSKFFTTIASDLFVRIPSIRPHIREIIENEPDIFRKAAGKQLESLILQPLLDIQYSQQNAKPVVFVVDALDECEGDENIKLLIDLLTQKNMQSLPQLKVFITSRPELPIRLGFKKAAPETYQPLTLHKIPGIKDDIAVFFEHHLSKIRSDFNDMDISEGGDELASDWPGQQRTQELVDMSVPLFIFAATVCRFIEDRIYGHPDDLLEEILRDQAKGQCSQLQKAYLPVLERFINNRPDRQREEVLERFRLVVGSIILVARPLSKEAIASILAVERRVVDQVLCGLHSVINVPDKPGSAVRLFHLSFRDYLLGPDNEKSSFWIKEASIHETLASKCLDRLETTLKENICHLEGPGSPRSSIESAVIDNCISPEVQYSCCYWVFHCQRAGSRLDDQSQAYRFLKIHFLHWLEVLSILGKAYQCVHYLKDLKALTDPESKELLEFLDDAETFVLSGTRPIDLAPLQLYSSMLAFAPTKSKIRRLFLNKTEGQMVVQNTVETSWREHLLTLDGHTGRVGSVRFSHDSKFVLTASQDSTIRIWDSLTGQCVRELGACYQEEYTSAIFSHDSALILSASPGVNLLRLWRVSTGECIYQVKPPTDEGNVVFSPTSELFASWSHLLVTLWRVETGECIGQFKADQEYLPWDHGIRAVVFTPEARILVCTDDGDGRVQVFDFDSHHSIYVQDFGWGGLEIAFSHDAMWLAIGGDRSHQGIALVQLSRKEIIRTLSAEGPVRIGFSPDSRFLISATSRGSVKIWHISTGECIQAIETSCFIYSNFFFSYGSAFLALIDSPFVRIWRVASSAQSNQTVRSSDDIGSAPPERPYMRVQFSPDFKRVLSSSDYSTAVMWNVATGECLWSCEGFGNGRCEFISNSMLILIFWGRQGSAEFLHVDTGEPLSRLESGEEGLLLGDTAAASVDSTLFASSVWEFDPCPVKIWDMSTGKLIQTLKPTSIVHSLVFSPDSKAMTICTGRGGEVSLWDITSGTCKQETLPIYGTWSVFSPDSSIIVGANEGRVSAWRRDLGSLQTITSTDGKHHGNPIIAFAEQSNTLAVSGAGRIVICNLDTGNVLHSIQTSVQARNLTFELDDSRLFTDFGAFDLSHPQGGNNVMSFSRSGFGVSTDGCWVMWNERKLYYIHPEYRWAFAVSGATISLISEGNRVAVFTFPSASSPENPMVKFHDFRFPPAFEERVAEQ